MTMSSPPTAAHRSDRRLARSFLPQSAVLEMTYRCNHACVFCSCPWYAKGGNYPVEKEQSTAQWQSTIAMLVDRGVCDLAFTGGEPLLRNDLVDIVSFAAHCVGERVQSIKGQLVVTQQAPALSLLSNGRIMSDAILSLCRQHNMRLSMSLPGLSTFTEHTGRGDPQTVLRWFARARDFGVRTTVGVTVTRRNLFELYETIGEALLAGADTLLLNRFLPGGRGLAHQDLVLDVQGVLQMLDIAEQVLKTAGRYGSVGTELPLCILERRRYEHLDVGSRCSAARSFFAIDPAGHVRVCNHSPVRLGHISSADALADDPYWRRFADHNYSPSACAWCTSRCICDGGCREAAHILTGHVDGLDTLMASGPHDDRDMPHRASPLGGLR